MAGQGQIPDERRVMQYPYLSRTVLICSAGLHLSFSMSRQIRPSLSIFGWYIFVKNRT